LANVMSVSSAHRAELLCAKQNLDSCKLAHARKVAISLCTVTRPTAAHLALLSCYQAVDVPRLVSRALFFDKLRSGKSEEAHCKSRFPAGFVQSICWLFNEGTGSRGGRGQYPQPPRYCRQLAIRTQSEVKFRGRQDQV